MAEIRKYAFDMEFDPKGGAATLARSAARFTQADLDAARAEGVNAGRADAQAKAEQAVAAQMQSCAQALARLREALSAETRLLRAEARTLALALARQAAEAALDAYGDERITAAFDLAMEDLGAQARIVVRVGAEALERLRPALEEIAEAHGFAGALVLRPLPSAAPGDVMIEWGEGAIAIDLYDAFERLDAALAAAAAEAEAGEVQ